MLYTNFESMWHSMQYEDFSHFKNTTLFSYDLSMMHAYIFLKIYSAILHFSAI